MNKKLNYLQLLHAFNPRFLTYTILTGVISMCMLSMFNAGTANAQPGAGIYDSYVTVGGTQYYLGYSALPSGFSTNVNSAPAFNGVNFGTFSSTAILDITAGIAYTFRANNGNSGNVCGNPAIYYAIFPVGTPAGYGSFPLSSNTSLSPNINNYYRQSWSGTTTTNVLSGLTPGTTYSFQVYVTAPVNLTGTGSCNDSAFANGLPGTAGAYYTATFSIAPLKCPPAAPTGTNLITNGDFSAGNSGFTSAYTLVTPTGTSEPGEYWIGAGADSKTFNSTFVTTTDPLGSTGNIMMIDGNSPTAGLNVWSETVSVTANTVYSFSFYLASMDAISPANLYFYANGTAFGGEVNAPSASNEWTKVTKTWCSGSNTTVTISIIDSNDIKVGNDFALDSISLRSSPSITSILAGNDTTICNGNSTQLNPTPGACEYNWTPSASLNNDSIQMPIASPTVTTTYTLIATVPGCTNDTLPPTSVVVTVGTNIPISAGRDTSICSGSVTLQGSGGTTYSWSPSNSLSNASIATPVASPTATTTYTLTASTSGGCSGSASVIVTVGSSLKATTVPAHDTTVCSGQPVQFEVSGATQFTWSPSAGLSSSTIANPVATPTTNTTYTVTISDGGQCTASATIAVSIGGTLTVSAGSNTSVCSGHGTVLQGTGGGTYSWAPTNSLSDATTANPMATPTTTTTYTLTVTNGGCTGTATVVVAVGSFTPSVVPQDTSLCSNHSVQLGISTPTTSVSWSPAAGLSNADIANPVASPTTSTTYTATISNSGGCTATASVAVTVNPSYTSGQVSADPDTICPSTIASLTLAGNSSGAIQWQSSANPANGFTSISGASKTSYTTGIVKNSTYYRVIVGTGACADTSSPPFELYVISPPSTNFSASANGHVVTFTVSNTLGVTAYSWDFGDGSALSSAQNPVHTYDSAGTYDVCLTVRNNSNCNFTNCQNVTAFPTGINNIANDNTWLVYPDPFGATLYISTGSAAVRAQRIEIFDVLGRRVYLATSVTSNPIKIDLTGLVTGAYFVRITTPQGDFVRKVIKE